EYLYQAIHDVAIELKELRREMEGESQLDQTVPPSALGGELGGSETVQSNTTSAVSATLPGQTLTGAGVAARTNSSTEIILGEIKKHKLGVVFTLIGLLLVAAIAGYLWIKFGGSAKTEPFRAMKITRLTTGGRIGNAQIKGYAT